MDKNEDLKLLNPHKQWDHDPQWFESPFLELSGPFWSIIIQQSHADPKQYDLIVSCSQGEVTYSSVGTDLEIVKNKATLLYNQIIKDLKEARSTNEPD